MSPRKPSLISVPFQYLACGLLAATCALLYGFTLNYPFIFDDYIYLVDNPLARDSQSFLFLRDFTSFANRARELGLDPDLSTNFILRPFAYLTFFLNYAFGGLNPEGFRAVNIALHGVNGILVFQILSHLLSISEKRDSLSAASTRFISLTAALLFVAHPMQIESVTYVIQRFTSLGTFWYLFAIRAHFLANVSLERTYALLWRVGALVGLVLGMLSKEFLFTAPFMLVIIDCFIVGTPLRDACKRAAPLFLCLPIIPALILLTSWAQHGAGGGLGSALRVADPFSPRDYQMHYALTQPGVILTYLRLLLVPVGLNLDPDHPISRSFWEWRVVGSLLVLVGIGAASAWWYARRREDLRASLLFCSVAWFFLGLSIDSSIVPLPDVMAEHRAYLSSVGVLTALACLADSVGRRFAGWPGFRHLVPTGIAVWVLILGGAAVARNRVWASEIGIWEDTVSKSPNKPRPWLNLGAAYSQSERHQEAASAFRQAIKLQPAYLSAYSNLVKTENTLGRYREAVEAGLAGARYAPAPYDYMLYQNLGAAFFALGENSNSVACFRASAASRPDYRPAHLALASLYTQEKSFELALRHYRLAAALEPLDPITQRTVHQIEALLIRQSTAAR